MYQPTPRYEIFAPIPLYQNINHCRESFSGVIYSLMNSSATLHKLGLKSPLRVLRFFRFDEDDSTMMFLLYDGGRRPCIYLVMSYFVMPCPMRFRTSS
jgi:hypothetical protein